MTRCNYARQRLLLCMLPALFFCLGIQAQTAMTVNVLRAVDAAFAEQSSEKLDVVLAASRQASDYGELETYTLKKIRQFVVLNELDFAKAASLVMIDNNMENDEALAIYSSTSKAIERRTQQLQEQKEQEEKLAAIKEADKIKLAETPSPEKSYAPVMNVVSGETFYYSVEEAVYSPINWEVTLGLVDLNLVTGRKDPALKYGLSAGGEFFYSTDAVIIGGELFADMGLLSFFGDTEVSFSVKAIPSISVDALSNRLFFRVGFLYDGGFMSPVLGVAYKKFGGTQMGYDVYADYYIGHLAKENMAVAFSAGGSVFFPLVKGDFVNMGLRLGLSDTVYLYDDGLDNSLKCIFSLRVGN